MATEIERKFLLEEPPEQLRGRTGKRIEQGYLAAGGSIEIRLRKLEERRLLTAKLGHGESRIEVEIAIDAGQFEALWPLTESRRLRKTRYLVPLGSGLEAEIDVFADDLAGLVTAEVEFGDEEQSQDFPPPPWLGEEVTGDRRYANGTLASAGVPSRAPATTKGTERADIPSRAYRLKSNEAPADGVRRIAEGRAARALERLEGVEGAALASAVHGARKDLKKLRALLRAVRPEIGAKRFKVENRRYRDAGRLLSGSRDAEVKLETLAKLADQSPDLPVATLDAWEGMLEAERDELAAALREGEDGQIAAAREAIEAGRSEIERWPLHTDSWELVGSGLTESYRAGRALMKRVETGADPGDVHEWRKRAKDLWYLLRIVRDAWPELLGPTVDQAHKLAELLGEHHDLTVLAADLRRREGTSASDRDAFEKAILARQGAILEAALGIGGRLYAEKPNAFGRRIRAYWRAWRED